MVDLLTDPVSNPWPDPDPDTGTIRIAGSRADSDPYPDLEHKIEDMSRTWRGSGACADRFGAFEGGCDERESGDFFLRAQRPLRVCEACTRGSESVRHLDQDIGTMHDEER